jgi:hypothetical protein
MFQKTKHHAPMKVSICCQNGVVPAAAPGVSVCIQMGPTTHGMDSTTPEEPTHHEWQQTEPRAGV